MGLIKKSQVLNSNTLDLINNLVEIKDNSITSEKLGFDCFEKIAEIITTSNVTDIDITNLDGNNEQPYVLFLNLKNATEYDCVIYLFINNDTDSSNYQYVLL